MISSAAFSANIMTGAFRLALVTSGITEASTILKLDTPRTLCEMGCKKINRAVARHNYFD